MLFEMKKFLALLILLFSISSYSFDGSIFQNNIITLHKDGNNIFNGILLLNIPDGWIVYSEKKSLDGSPFKISILDDKKLKNFTVIYPESLFVDDNYIFNSEMKQASIDISFVSDDGVFDEANNYLDINYVMCNKKNNECKKNQEQIYFYTNSL